MWFCRVHSKVYSIVYEKILCTFACNWSKSQWVTHFIFTLLSSLSYISAGTVCKTTIFYFKNLKCKLLVIQFLNFYSYGLKLVKINLNNAKLNIKKLITCFLNERSIKGKVFYTRNVYSSIMTWYRLKVCFQPAKNCQKTRRIPGNNKKIHTAQFLS